MRKIAFCLGLILELGGSLAYGDGSHVHSSHRYSGALLPNHSVGDEALPKVYLYDDKGVWDVGREHLKLFMQDRKYSYEVIDAKTVLSGELDPQAVLIMPGGESWEYLASLGADGKDKILKFVDQGGGYVGICAGAFFASSMRDGGYATGPYGIGLLEGTAYDGTAYATKPFIEGMLDFSIERHLFTAGIGSPLRIVLFGGPSFRFSAGEALKKGILTVSRFPEINEPAMIVFHYGQGQVFLSGPHLEVEEARENWGKDFEDPESDWPLLERMMQWVSPAR